MKGAFLSTANRVDSAARANVGQVQRDTTELLVIAARIMVVQFNAQALTRGLLHECLLFDSDDLLQKKACANLVVLIPHRIQIVVDGFRLEDLIANSDHGVRITAALLD